MIITETPLRLSLLGGGTDFDDFYLKHDGAVLSGTINKHIYVVCRKSHDNMVYVNYSRKEIVADTANLKHGLVREALKICGIRNGIEVTTLADIPSEGAGLGCSSALTVGLLQAFHAFQRETVSAKTLAEQACQIEIDILGQPMGRQDQYIAAYGDTRFITFKSHDISAEPLEISADDKKKLNDSLLLFYTGYSRKSADILTEQKANINNNLGELKKIKELAFAAKDSLSRGNIAELGEIMHCGWEIKRNLASKVSNPQIDKIYHAARKAGAIGGKIAGAGGGGYLLLCCPSHKQDSVRNAVNGLQEMPYRFQPEGSKIIFNYECG